MAENLDVGPGKWLHKVADAVPATDGNPSKGPTYRSIYAKDAYVNLGPGIDTMWTLFKASVEKFGDNQFLGKRSIVDGKAGPFEWDTYSEVHAKVLKLGSAYRAAGLDANAKVGIYGINSPEWFMAMEVRSLGVGGSGAGGCMCHGKHQLARVVHGHGGTLSGERISMCHGGSTLTFETSFETLNPVGMAGSRSVTRPSFMAPRPSGFWPWRYAVSDEMHALHRTCTKQTPGERNSSLLRAFPLHSHSHCTSSARLCNASVFPSHPDPFLFLQACNCQSMQCVPLYDTLGAEAVSFILNHAEVALVVVQATKLPAWLKSVPNSAHLALILHTLNVKTVVSMGELDADSAKALTDMGIRGVSWDDFLKEGEAKPVEPCPSKPEDICTIMYTSGTTGEPKGVLITNHALATAVAGTKRFCEVNDYVLTTTDIYISYLPLAHIFDRVAEELMTHVGGSIGFWQGDVRKLTDDLEALKPTFFCGVPRIFDRIHSAVVSKIESTGGLTKMLFDYAYSSKQARLAAGVKIRDATPIFDFLVFNKVYATPLFDFLVFNKVKARLGGNVRIICSGAAPLAPHVEEFLKIAMCCPVVQGYGLTETNTSGFISYADRIEQAGTVGPPMPTLETRLESIPEMNYDAIGAAGESEKAGGDSGEAQARAHPPRGEVCIRGPILFSGYYKREDLTGEAVDAEGWFHTGDIGEWQADGSMKIIDRKKNIFKLAQGEYVAVENLENVFGNCTALDMVWVYGNSFEAVLVAVVVPNKPTLLEWAKGAGVEGDYAALCGTEEAKKFILGQLTETGKKGKLKGFEMVKAVYLEAQPFDMERDLLTPTFKKKRPQLLKYYEAQINAMYADLKK
ncbi:unnamed protein product [Closterium sp. NIES-54]